MTRKLIAAIAFLLLATAAKAQTVVSGTVQDASGNVYQGGTGRAEFVPSPTATTVSLVNGSTFQTSIPVIALDSFGKFTVGLTDNTKVVDGHTGAVASKWVFRFCSATLASQAPVCFPVGPLTISGSSMDISSTIQAAAAPLPGGASASVLGLDNIWTNNNRFKGPVPWIDVTAYGVRAVVTPPQTTATISAGSANATLAVAAAFKNGDGVEIERAGATNTMSTPGAPTVTPAQASGPIGMESTVAAPAGSTAYAYQIVARDKNGGLTVASASGATATGNTLGKITVAISSLSRSNDSITVVTSSAHGLSANAIVHISGALDASFSGFYSVSSITNSTTFVINNTPLDTRAGASTSVNAGGTVAYWACNKITWTAVAGAWQYYIYGRTAGSLTLLGVSKPTGAQHSDLEWNDYGSPMMDSISLPSYVPSTPPGAATNDYFVTTILSGAGTVNLTFTSTATTTVSSAVIKFDNAPNLVTAANAAVGTAGAVLFIPPTGNISAYYYLNSVTVLPVNLTVDISGVIAPNETLQIGYSNTWLGLGLTGGPPQFASDGSTGFFGTANPLVYMDATQHGQSMFYNLQFTGNSTNGALSLLIDDAAAMNFDYVNFQSSQANPADYVGIALYMRGSSQAYGHHFRHCSWLGGPNQVADVSMAPEYIDEGAWIFIQQGQLARRTVAFKAFNGIIIDWLYAQGSIQPLVSLLTPGSGGVLECRHCVLDTTAVPEVANFDNGSGHFVGSVFLDSSQTGTTEAGGIPPSISGARPGLVKASGATFISASQPLGGQNRNSTNYETAILCDGVYSPDTTVNGGCTQNEQVTEFRGAVHFPAQHVLSFGSLTPTGLTGAVVAGGSVPVGAHTYFVSAIGQDGGESVSSAAANVTTTSGNQTVNLSWNATTGATNYIIYRDGNAHVPGACFRVTTNSCSDTSATLNGGPGPNYDATGPTSISQAQIVTPKLIAGTTAVASGTADLGTAAIASGACATVVTVSAPGTLTTDNILGDFNADPTGVVGYQPVTSGMLTIIKYPTANNVNFKVCNTTSGSITPGAIRLNWRVPR
jgi:hypothetical protein